MRRLQIIVVALLGGAGSFLILAAALVITGEARGEAGVLVPVLFAAWAAVSLGGFVAWPIIRGRQAVLAAAALEAAGEDGRAVAIQRYATSTIVGAALAEGTMMLAAVAGFVTGHPGLLAVGLAGLVVMVLLFPSQSKLERFLELGCRRANGTTPR